MAGGDQNQHSFTLRKYFCFFQRATSPNCSDPLGLGIPDNWGMRKKGNGTEIGCVIGYVFRKQEDPA